jgi:2-hydroxychromene-2-carboxylate isomerase
VSASPAAFYFDLASPLAYFAAERVLHVLPVAAEWRPVLARELAGVTEAGGATGPAPPAPVVQPGDDVGAVRCEQEEEIRRDELARRASELALQPLRLPHDFPFDSELAMRVATYAASIGRAVPFAQAAFRQAFAGGRSLADADNVLIAAAACEMHPTAVVKGAGLASTARALRENIERARADGVDAVPAIWTPDGVLAGERAVPA